MKEFKEQVLSKVKTLLLNTEELLEKELSLCKNDRYANLSVSNKEDDSCLFSVGIRKYDTYKTTTSPKEIVMELEVNVNGIGSYMFSLTDEEYIEITYLFNNLYEEAQPKFLTNLTL